MSEEAGKHPSITERITEKVHEYRGSSSSSDSDNKKPSFHSTRKKRLFGRKGPVHTVLGGGKSADIILWRNKQMSGGILAVSFIWSNAASLVNRSPPKFPEAILPEDMFLNIAQAVRYHINGAFATFRYVASGKELKQFLMVIAGLWVVSVIGNWFSFLTLSYMVFLIIYTAPALYEKYEDQVDNIAEKATVEINKHYAVLDEKILQKIPRGPFANKKKL
ncbi:reticulon-like protein B5 isoform X2 [Elaeis guineensis]|uniref:reticulon-like protein B5 isoform X2 n=1 Tax=Elaeis guineensis var. tenera TaxID=51953 RepID=UPI003C6D014C